jgi:nicotinamide mononucleotide transporter
LIEQVYYLLTGFYGWWVWLSAGKPDEKKQKTALKITHSSTMHNLIYAGAIVIGTAALGWFMARIQIFFPSVFPEAASFPYLDAFTTVVSFAATILIIYKKIECWHLWILVDIIGVGLYFAKGVVFVSLLYFIFLILATNGLITWLRIYNKEKSYDHRTGDRQVLPAA